MEYFSFFVDPAREKNLIITMFSGFDPAGLESRAEQTGIPIDLARRASQHQRLACFNLETSKRRSSS